MAALLEPTIALQEELATISVEQYHQMIQAGILMSGDPVELLEGYLVQKTTKNPPTLLPISSCMNYSRRYCQPAGL